jgi:hypothetical protein
LRSQIRGNIHRQQGKVIFFSLPQQRVATDNAAKFAFWPVSIRTTVQCL